jgi:hypothetical protein
VYWKPVFNILGGSTEVMLVNPEHIKQVPGRKTYASAQYSRLARRRGRKKACVAVGHSLLVMGYQVLWTGQPYRERGADYFDKKDPQRLASRLIRRLQELGLKVTVETQNAASHTRSFHSSNRRSQIRYRKSQCGAPCMMVCVRSK